MNIQELLSEANVKVYEAGEHHHVSHGWIGVDCPYCGPNTARLGIPIARPVVANCWLCGAHSVYDVLLQLGGGTLARQLKKVEFDDPLPKIQRRGTLKLPKIRDPLSIIHKKHMDLLMDKNINPFEAERIWKVEAITLAVKYAWSLFIPITLDGEVVSFTTRYVRDDKDKRYQFADACDEAVPAKDVLYGADLARGSIIITEGPLDAMAVGAGGTSIMGLAYTRNQVLQASRFRRIVVCLDAEPGAQRVASRLCGELACFGGDVRNVLLESGKDPSRASQKELKQLRSLIR